MTPQRWAVYLTRLILLTSFIGPTAHASKVSRCLRTLLEFFVDTRTAQHYAPSADEIAFIRTLRYPNPALLLDYANYLEDRGLPNLAKLHRLTYRIRTASGRARRRVTVWEHQKNLLIDTHRTEITRGLSLLPFVTHMSPDLFVLDGHVKYVYVDRNQVRIRSEDGFVPHERRLHQLLDHLLILDPDTTFVLPQEDQLYAARDFSQMRTNAPVRRDLNLIAWQRYQRGETALKEWASYCNP